MKGLTMLDMFSKINPWVILKGHFGTFGDINRNGKWRDFVLFYAVPFVVGAAIGIFGKTFDVGKCINTSVNVLAIFIPLAFSVLVELITMMERDAVRSRPGMMRLAQDLYWNVSYGIFSATAVLCALLAIDFFDLEKGHVVGGMFVTVALHFLLLALMLCKRFSKLMDPHQSK